MSTKLLIGHSEHDVREIDDGEQYAKVCLDCMVLISYSRLVKK